MLDLFGGAEERDAGLAQVAANEGDKFYRDAFGILKEFKGQKIITEQVKIRMEMRGCCQPHHHNVWGDFATEARKLGLLIKCKGELRQCALKRAHKRWAQVYFVP